MYQYQIKKGAENKVFAGQGVKNLGNGMVESDHELRNPDLTPVEQNTEQAAPAPPVSPPNPPAPTSGQAAQSPNLSPQVSPQTNTQAANTEVK